MLFERGASACHICLPTCLSNPSWSHEPLLRAVFAQPLHREREKAAALAASCVRAVEALSLDQICNARRQLEASQAQVEAAAQRLSVLGGTARQEGEGGEGADGTAKKGKDTAATAKGGKQLSRVEAELADAKADSAGLRIQLGLMVAGHNEQCRAARTDVDGDVAELGGDATCASTSGGYLISIPLGSLLQAATESDTQLVCFVCGLFGVETRASWM